MIKLTRLSHQVVVINPDHIVCIEVSPDTTLVLLNGDRIIVLESLDDLVAQVIEFRRKVRSVEPLIRLGEASGDPPRSIPPPPATRNSRHPHNG